MRKLVFLITGLVLANCTFAQSTVTPRQIWGIWKNEHGGTVILMTLSPDGTGELGGVPIHHRVEGDSLILLQDGQQSKYGLSVRGNELTLYGGASTQVIVFVRAGEGPAGLGQSASSLIGLWSDGKEMIDFRNDGYCVYGGERFPYRVAADQIVISTNDVPVRMTFAVSQDALTLTVKGEPNHYRRVAGQGLKEKISVKESRMIPPELLGEWCQKDPASPKAMHCITLFADGSYAYTFDGQGSRALKKLLGPSGQERDMGTWHVEEGRWHYQSSGSGLGSFRLEKRNQEAALNYPAIVLEGIPFVSSIPRSPWR